MKLRVAMRPRALPPAPRTQRGMMLIGALVMLAVLAMGSVSYTMTLAESNRRSNELELLSVGEQYRAAIDAYWRSSPGGVMQWPTKLEDLVEDKRFPKPKRHLRKLFHDPMAPDQDWGIAYQGIGIVGVYSRAKGEPFKKTGFDLPLQKDFEDAKRYDAWVFTALAPPVQGLGLGQGARGGAGTGAVPPGKPGLDLNPSFGSSPSTTRPGNALTIPRPRP